MTAIVKRIEKGLGKVRMATVADIFDDGHAIDITLTDHTWDVWEYKINGQGDFTAARSFTTPSGLSTSPRRFLSFDWTARYFKEAK